MAGGCPITRDQVTSCPLSASCALGVKGGGEQRGEREEVPGAGSGTPASVPPRGSPCTHVRLVEGTRL